MDDHHSSIGSAPAPLRPRGRVVKRGTFAILGVNLVGIAWYLWGAAHAWAIPAERAAGINSVTGEPFVWAMFVFPVWAAFLLLNGVWIGVAAARRQRRQLAPILVVIAMWACAIVVDYAHH
jgi:hypothetical protein